jgi:hypothetical protein
LAMVVQQNNNDLLASQLNKEMACVMLLMHMPMDIFRTYNKVFYLPIPKSYNLVIPGKKQLAPELRFVDDKIQEYMERIKLPHDVLDGTYEENLEKLLECFTPSELSVSQSDSISSD